MIFKWILFVNIYIYTYIIIRKKKEVWWCLLHTYVNLQMTLNTYIVIWDCSCTVCNKYKMNIERYNRSQYSNKTSIC